MIFAHFFYLHCMESANRECTCFESTDILFWVLLFMLKNAEIWKYLGRFMLVLDTSKHLDTQFSREPKPLLFQDNVLLFV